MKEHYTVLNGYAHSLLDKGESSEEIGLWNGKMGIAICMLHLYRITEVKRYEEVASELIDNVYEKISFKMPLSFESGLIGIGCGFQYIIRNGFVDANSDEILSDIDYVIMNSINMRSIDSLSFENGVCGLVYYLYLRLKDRPELDNNIRVLRLKEHLIYSIDWLECLILEENNVNNINDAYFILCRIYKLKVFNYKVEKLIDHCMQRLIATRHLISDKYECLGVQSLKLLKPWM